MVGAAQGVLEVAENRIHPSKLWALDSGSPAAHHHRLMNAARRGDAMKAGQPIGDDPSACTEVELRPGGDFGETEALHDGELHAQRVSLLVGLHGRLHKAFFDMLGVFAEFETNLRRERQAEGVAAAKQRATYRGRPPSIDMEAIKHRLARGLSPTAIARELRISRGTVYKARADMTDIA